MEEQTRKDSEHSKEKKPRHIPWITKKRRVAQDITKAYAENRGQNSRKEWYLKISGKLFLREAGLALLSASIKIFRLSEGRKPCNDVLAMLLRQFI